MATNHWPAIHAERKALADDLSALTKAQWLTPSLCSGWNVQQAVAHQVATAKQTALGFFTSLAASGFSFTRFVERGVAAETKGGPEGLVAGLREAATKTTSPPGPKLSWLGEALVHAEDVRRPLGITRSYPVEQVVKVIEFYAGSSALIGGKKRVAGLTLKATDADFSRGTGPLVEGPAMSLLMVTAGRMSFLEDLSGPGVELLRQR